MAVKTLDCRLVVASRRGGGTASKKETLGFLALAAVARYRTLIAAEISKKFYAGARF
jgi:hypothetical protein